MDAHQTVRVVADAVLERAEQLLPLVDWMPATVKGYDRSTLVATVVLDDDLVLGGPDTDVVSMIGDVGLGQRVMVQRVNRQASAVMAQITGTPEQPWTPQLSLSSDGVTPGPSVGAGGLVWGGYRIDRDEVQAHVEWSFGTGAAAGPLGVSWIFDLPHPLKANWGPAGFAPNRIIGDGWVFVVATGLPSWLYRVVVDAPLGLNGLDARFAGMRVDKVDTNQPSNSGGSPGVVGTTGNNNTGIPFALSVLSPGTKISLSLRYPAE